MYEELAKGVFIHTYQIAWIAFGLHGFCEEKSYYKLKNLKKETERLS